MKKDYNIDELPFDDKHLLRKDRENAKDILTIFLEARNKNGIGSGRCPLCGGIFQDKNCIECGHKI